LYDGSSIVGLSRTNSPVGTGVGEGVTENVGVGVGGVDARVGVNVEVDSGEGVAVGAVVGARVAVCEGVTEVVGVRVGEVDAKVGVNIDVAAGEGVTVGAVAGVRAAVGDGSGMAVSVAAGLDVGVWLGSDTSPSDELVVGILADVGVSARNLSSPRAGVKVLSKAATVAIRICVALSLLVARIIRYVNSTASTMINTVKPAIRRLRFFILIFTFSVVQEGVTIGQDFSRQI
jgi:hypothetical protein